MGITQTTEQYYDYSTAKDIYKLLGTGNDWAPYLRTETGLDKPRILAKGKASKDLFQTNVKNPRIANASGTILIDGRILEVSRVMSHTLITPEDWRAEFPEFQPKGTTLDLKMNPTVMSTVMDLLKTTTEEMISDVDYQGDDALSTQLKYYDGFSKIAKADADVVDVANVGVISVDNVLGIISSVENNIPVRIAKKVNKIKIFMSRTTFNLAQEADRLTQQNSTYLRTQDTFKSPKGYELVWLPSVSDNEIFATIAGTGKDSNLVKGVWFNGEESNFLLWREHPADEDWMITLKFSMGVQYRAGADVVLYVGS
jgi:hypothetical protein